MDFRAFAIGVGLAALISWAVHAWFDVNFWLVIAIVIFALLVNGIVAVIEDDAPGGFNDPGDESSPTHRE
jgi:hypothetical protein